MTSFKPLDECPRKDTDPSDTACIEKIVNSLVEQLDQALDIDKKNNLPRIALFGGFGQGKTSALIQAIKKLETKKTVDYWFFNISSYKADQLEFEFERMVKAKTILTPIKVITIPIAAAAIFFLFITPYIEAVFHIDGRLFVGLLGGILGYVTRGYKEDISYWENNYKRLFSLTGESSFKIKNLLKKPKIIIIDNLDRATITQQRAILRALYKEKEALNFIFVICMDETKLLESSPDPEDPSELLRKSIDLELRLPTRFPQDAVLLTQEIIKQAIEKNDEDKFQALFLDPIFSSDFATVLSLLNNFSPRIAKRLINNAIVHAEQLQVLAHTEDCTALLKLYMLYFTFPFLRHFPHELMTLLEDRNESEIESALKNIPDKEHEKLKSFLSASQGIQPLDGNWKRLFAIRTNNNTQHQKNIVKIEESFLVKNKEIYHEIWSRLIIIKNNQSISEFGALIEYLKDNGINVDEQYYHIWMSLQVVLAQTISSDQRFTLISIFRRELKKKNSKIKERLDYAVWRYCLGDLPVYELMVKEEKIKGTDDFFSNIKNKLSPNNISLSIALAKIITKNNEFYEIIFERLLNPGSKTALEFTQIKENNILFSSLWSPLLYDDNWESNLKKQLSLLLLYVDEIQLIPDSLEYWFHYTANKEKIIQDGKSKELLECLQSLLYNPYKKSWSLDGWHKLFDNSEYKFILDLIYNTETILLDDNWFTALLLLCDLNYDTNNELKTEIENSFKKLLSSVKKLNTTQLTETLLMLLDKNSITLLHSASSTELFDLFAELLTSSNPEWQKFKSDYKETFKNLFDGHNNEEYILEEFDLL